MTNEETVFTKGARYYIYGSLLWIAGVIVVLMVGYACGYMMKTLVVNYGNIYDVPSYFKYLDGISSDTPILLTEWIGVVIGAFLLDSGSRVIKKYGREYNESLKRWKARLKRNAEVEENGN